MTNFYSLNYIIQLFRRILFTFQCLNSVCRRFSALYWSFWASYSLLPYHETLPGACRGLITSPDTYQISSIPHTITYPNPILSTTFSAGKYLPKSHLKRDYNQFGPNNGPFCPEFALFGAFGPFPAWKGPFLRAILGEFRVFGGNFRNLFFLFRELRYLSGAKGILRFSLGFRCLESIWQHS